MIRHQDTKESREFWRFVERASARVARWPRWKIAAGLYAVRGYPPSVCEIDEVKRGVTH